MTAPDPLRHVARMDIYLLDQLLRGRIREGARVFDAGCGRGRNLTWFLAHGHPVSGIDADPGAVEACRALALEFLGPEAAEGCFRVADLADLPEDEGPLADLVICNAVLHFARDAEHLDALLHGAWSRLAPGGVFFARLASSIGIEERIEPLGVGRYRLPDGSDRFLVSEADLLERTEALGARLLDPLKTTNVQGLRCMTTWVMEKGPAA